jgi:hypothetical protein
MNKEEARAVLTTQLAPYRLQTYVELQRLLNTQDTFEVTGPSGAKYQLEIQAMWDSERRGNLRVMASIDDFGWRAFCPLTDDFIIDPEGRFVGE